MHAVAKKLFLLACVNKLSFRNGWLALKDVLSVTPAPYSQREKKGKDPRVWPTNAPSPASPPNSVEGDHSLHRLKLHWIIAVAINVARVITDIASYAPRSGPRVMQVDSFTRQSDLLGSLYVFYVVNHSCLLYTVQRYTY